MDDLRRRYTTRLFRLASPLFLYLVSFRRKVQRGYAVGEEMVRQEIEAIFGRMEEQAKQDPRLLALYDKAKYPLVVLADEVLLHSDWPHAPTWQQRLLEEKYFKTNVGGDLVFQQASELHHDEVELAAIYFAVISLGVQGSLFRNPQKLAEVKNKLYRQIGEYLDDVQGVLTPAARHVTPKDAVRLSPAVTLVRLLVVAFGIAVLYWIATRITWGVLLADLRTLVENLTTAAAS